eukprot:TRINITY_DN2205_c0_g3_i1.p1 TRINITY_DN2205_c0_g3~~TRINITY_DN2205_c0_g3_i1.p1  ORF type:complete len:601 (+),score=84.48 TRINITY_DN2205_c0_g3_i1:37-1839(+)
MASPFLLSDADVEDFLPGVGADIDSDVGGTGAQAKDSNDDFTEVAFWGICDIKYDPRLPKQDRVRVLELGDGRSSRFSHHGRVIKERFDAKYCMAATPIKRAVMTENKKFTHDMFLQEGFGHLRPPTAAYPRRYEPDLAKRIVLDLNVRDGGAVVLKLLNRSRGAGIVVVTSTELDSVLKRLLTPPLDSVDAWLAKRAPNALQLHPDTKIDLYDEQCAHWWANECPLFLVELCCESGPVEKDPGSSILYDGTLRVAFALYRSKSNRYQEQREVKPFEIDWLGGYWKLPKNPVPSGSCSEDGLLQIHDRVVSSFNSIDKRTAEVPQEHLQEVYDALTPALPRIFTSGAISVQMIMNVYRLDDLFCAFALARVAAAMRVDHFERALGLFDLAKRKVKQPKTMTPQFLPEISVLSYIDRNLGVCSALIGKWDDAARLFRSSILQLSTNATSYYLEGRYHQEQSRYDDAVQCQMKAIMLDPDFKLPYQALGNCELARRNFEGAMNAALSCFKRHPDAPYAQFIAGQAIYHILLQARGPSSPGSDNARNLADKAAKALTLARRRHPEHWTETDEIMLQYVKADERERARLQKQDVHVWRLFGYRP